MAYLKFMPAPALQPYVMCYYIWEHTQPVQYPLIINSPPKGLGGLVVNYSDTYYASTGKGEWKQVPDSFIAGHFTKNYSLCLQGRIGMIGVVFMPAAITQLLGVPMIELTNHRIELSLVLGNEASVIVEQVLAADTHKQRIQVIEQFLLKKLFRKKVDTDLVDYALDSIIQRRGILSIEQLSDDVCISLRHFRRLFTHKVGISPKLYARIKRFNYLTLLTESGSASWADVVYQGGYYDQAHFIKDFCDFSGKKPSDYVNYNRQLAQLLEA